jgi:hypothetical protein
MHRSFKNRPLAKMQVGLIRLALLPVMVMWKSLPMWYLQVCLTSLEGPRFRHFFSSVEGQLALIQEDVEPLLSNSARSFLPLLLLLLFTHLTCHSTEDKILS